MRYVRTVLALLIIATILLTCSLTDPVKGVWHYALSISDAIHVPVSVEVFPWVGADQLPDDVLGEDHQSLIQAILNGTYTDKNGNFTYIGLNNPDSYINNEINSRVNGNFLYRSDVLGSMDYWERSDISKFFDTGTSGLSFLLYFPDGMTDTYYLYTTSISLGSSDPNIPIGQSIYPVYRTELTRGDDSVWVAVETKTGFAESAYYQNPVTGSWLLKYPSFDPDTWTEGDLGNSTADAIYTYVGETTTAYIKDATTPKYYRVTASSNQTITVASEDSSHILRVYNSQMNLVSTNGGAQGTNRVSFRASRNTTYYIEVSGATSITFTVS